MSPSSLSGSSASTDSCRTRRRRESSSGVAHHRIVRIHQRRVVGRDAHRQAVARAMTVSRSSVEREGPVEGGKVAHAVQAAISSRTTLRIGRLGEDATAELAKRSRMTGSADDAASSNARAEGSVVAWSVTESRWAVARNRIGESGQPRHRGRRWQLDTGSLRANRSARRKRDLRATSVRVALAVEMCGPCGRAAAALGLGVAVLGTLWKRPSLTVRSLPPMLPPPWRGVATMWAAARRFPLFRWLGVDPGSGIPGATDARHPRRSSRHDRRHAR